MRDFMVVVGSSILTAVIILAWLLYRWNGAAIAAAAACAAFGLWNALGAGKNEEACYEDYGDDDPEEDGEDDGEGEL